MEQAINRGLSIQVFWGLAFLVSFAEYGPNDAKERQKVTVWMLSC